MERTTKSSPLTGFVGSRPHTSLSPVQGCACSAQHHSKHSTQRDTLLSTLAADGASKKSKKDHAARGAGWLSMETRWVCK